MTNSQNKHINRQTNKQPKDRSTEQSGIINTTAMTVVAMFHTLWCADGSSHKDVVLGWSLVCLRHLI